MREMQRIRANEIEKKRGNERKIEKENDIEVIDVDQ